MDKSAAHEFTLFAVDDDESARTIVQAAFGGDFVFESFHSAEACLDRLPASKPNLILLDVGLPGIDGYTMCKTLKEVKEFADIPVIFISALDDLDSRLAGYDAGGIDFIVKPYRMEELRQKVTLALEEVASRNALRQQMDETDTLSSLILSSLDEYALLIRFLRALNGCESSREVADALFALLSSFKLEGAVQLRIGAQEVTYGEKGLNRPLEVSVIQHVRTLGSVFAFKNRAAFNYPNVTLLINNMPVEDNELCGRLRDHLAIAAESAHGRLDALQTRAVQARASDGIAHLIDSLEKTVRDFNERYDRARYQGSSATQAMVDELAASIAPLGLTAAQEDRLIDIVRRHAFDIVDLYDFGDDTQEALVRVHKQLSSVFET